MVVLLVQVHHHCFPHRLILSPAQILLLHPLHGPLLHGSRQPEVVEPGLGNNRLATIRAVSRSYSHPYCALLLKRVEDNT